MSKNILNVPKVWCTFSRLGKHNKTLRFRWEQLSEYRYKDFIDFKINYYVKHELTHTVSGIHKNPEAIEEYKEILTEQFKSPSCFTTICCLEETNEIVAFDAISLYRRGEAYKDFIQARTPEVKKFYTILHEWNNLFPVAQVMDKYGIDKYMDDKGCAIHPNWRDIRISYEISLMRISICKTYAVPLTGAWITCTHLLKTVINDNWEVIYEISCEELEKKLGVTFQNPPPVFSYIVKQIK